MQDKIPISILLIEEKLCQAHEELIKKLPNNSKANRNITWD